MKCHKCNKQIDKISWYVKNQFDNKVLCIYCYIGLLTYYNLKFIEELK